MAGLASDICAVHLCFKQAPERLVGRLSAGLVAASLILGPIAGQVAPANAAQQLDMSPVEEAYEMETSVQDQKSMVRMVCFEALAFFD